MSSYEIEEKENERIFTPTFSKLALQREYESRELRHLKDYADKNIVLNLKNITYIDNFGIGELISAYTSCSDRGSTIELMNVNKEIMDKLKMTKLDTVFPIRKQQKTSFQKKGKTKES